MEEEIGIKVTRLRRRLSVEADDVKSPSTQSTPTKKRGARLAAKPQLELIDENATEAEKPKRTRKTTAKDTDPEEKAVTPSRRSTRIRSNTSIVSETPAEPEDKGTPSRRSTKIKSNTSLVAETVQFSDSPRAKRAARRTSQVGSDNEAPVVTPARQTRRTRKDSTSSIDKQVEPADKLTTQVKEVIVEEPENSVKNTPSKDSPSEDKNESLIVRKSPRLIEKTGRKSTSIDSDGKENEPQRVIKFNNEKSDIVDGGTNISLTTKFDQSNEITNQNNLSVSSSNIIEELESELKDGKSDLNKTTSEVELQVKPKRHRTKSWTTISSSHSSDKNILSDTEATIKKKKNNLNLSTVSGSGDSILNKSNQNVQENEAGDNEVTLNSSTTSDKKKKKSLNKSIADTPTKNISIINTSTKLDRSATEVKKSSISISNDDFDTQTYDAEFTAKFFGAPPSGAIQSLVYIDESDSNAESAEKATVNKELETEDQCVPVVEHHLKDKNCVESKSNLSYEPMDIDETMPENVSLSVFNDKNDSFQQKNKDTGLEKRKSVNNISQVNNISIDNNASNSQRKSTILDLENDNEGTVNKSSRNSIINVINNDDTINKSLNKSKKKSETANIGVDIDDSNNQSIVLDNINKSLNKSKRKSSISNTLLKEDNNSVASGNESINKSSNKKASVTSDQDDIIDIGNNSIKSKRKSSILNIERENDLNKSSSISGIVNNIMINTSSHDCKENISASNINDDNVDSNIDNGPIIDKSLNKFDSKISKHGDKSKRKSSVSNIISNDEVDSKSSVNHIEDDFKIKSSNKSKRKSSTSNILSDDNVDHSSNKSIGKSTINDEDNDKSMNKSSSKSKRKSSMLQIESQTFDNSSNENKSTLVLSQLKDTSETNLPKDVYEFNDSKDSNEQLSKSVNVPNINKNKESDKNNLSLTYSTSTPLQQKSMKKLGMQINTSIIAPNSVTKVEKKGALNKSKKENSVLSQNYETSEPSDEEDEEDSNEEECSEEEEEDSEEENELMDKSKMVDDEAEEASDDYESGDSRSEGEREYEEQHEILEKGETLDSEDEDFSDDSNYEKGSFIVDSDEEDDELLSGSGDDLSLSANELSMSSKSKKKFNERKIKEQKKASREMFESRHKLNESDKSVKSDKPKLKKKNRKRLESSDEESGKDVDVQPKKHRRARIDSSQDISQPQSDADKSTSKKKVKRLSESVCEDTATNEKEISICTNNETDKVDPLSLQNIVKEEPKTPQRDLNISTVAITNIEEVEIDENVSFIKLNQTTDPLQATVAQDDITEEEESDESISENEEITQNYESMLKDLNKNSKKVKSLDISLNLNKKTKEKPKEPIVDQLNLTQIKKMKEVETGVSSESKPAYKDKSISKKTEDNVNIQDEGSSDSIDMKLLFNEDSTDGEITVTAGQTNDDKEVVEDFIPLKRTEAKTNIFDNTVVTQSTKDDSILNRSKSKKNKRNSSQPEASVEKNEQELGFFIDTTGTHTNINKSVTNTSLKGSAKKNKQKHNVSFANVEEIIKDDDSNDAPLEVTYYSNKNNKSKEALNSTQIDETNLNTTAESVSNSGKKKKKNKKSFNSSQNNMEEQVIGDTANDVAENSMNASVLSVMGSNKKKNKLSESRIEQETDKEAETETAHNVSMGSAKKQKNKVVSEGSVIQNIIDDNTTMVNKQDKTKKRKRKPSSNTSIEESVMKDDSNDLETSKLFNESLSTSNQRKKIKISCNDEVANPETQSAAAIVPELQPQITELDNPIGKKSIKKNKLTQDLKPDENSDPTTKKNKKRKERDDDDGNKLTKIIKQNSADKVHVPRLPANVIKQLDDKPKKDVETKAKVISTTSFKVETTKMRRNKPSQYLEQSVYLNDSIEEISKKTLLKKPKVLPFIPTASTSDQGFTTNFRINVIPQETQFVAQSNDMSNFKKDYLQKNRIKKLGTFEMYKRHRSVKISKF